MHIWECRPNEFSYRVYDQDSDFGLQLELAPTYDNSPHRLSLITISHTRSMKTPYEMREEPGTYHGAYLGPIPEGMSDIIFLGPGAVLNVLKKVLIMVLQGLTT